MDQVMIEKTTKIMATGNTKTEKTGKKEAEYTSDEQEIIRLNTKLKDLQDLYNNLGKENKGLAKENRELSAKTIEIQSLLNDANQENDEDIESLNMEVNELETENAVLTARIEEVYVRVDELNSIITKLIDA